MASAVTTIRSLRASPGGGARRARPSGATLLAFAALLGVVDAFAAHADVPQQAPGPFDGSWQATLSCPNAAGALGFSFRFAAIVRNGVLHGERGSAREAGWLQIDGPIAVDGAADLYVEGLVGAAPFAVGQRPAGTPYGYHVRAKFAGDHGEGQRVEGRPCTVSFTRSG
jgi:hypothetical protein